MNEHNIDQGIVWFNFLFKIKLWNTIALSPNSGHPFITYYSDSLRVYGV